MSSRSLIPEIGLPLQKLARSCGRAQGSADLMRHDPPPSDPRPRACRRDDLPRELSRARIISALARHSVTSDYRRAGRLPAGTWSPWRKRRVKAVSSTILGARAPANRGGRSSTPDSSIVNRRQSPQTPKQIQHGRNAMPGRLDHQDAPPHPPPGAGNWLDAAAGHAATALAKRPARGHRRSRPPWASSQSSSRRAGVCRDARATRAMRRMT